MLNGPFSPWPCYSEEEKQAAVAVLDSNKVNYWTGTEAREFEKEFAAFCQSNYAIAVANGTLALDLAWHALALPPGSEVIVTSRTFLASVSSIILAGLVPVFADVDLDSQNITPASIEAVITDNTRAILCVHLAGWPCEMEPIMALAKKHHLYVVEDCAQAHGGQYKGKPVGSWGHISAWSFCQDKIMTTAGEGGMVTTDNKDFWSRMWSYKDHGKSYEAVYERQHPPGFRWLHESFGSNWRLTEIQAAIGRIQLHKMPDWHARRAANAHKLFDAARHCPALRVPTLPSHIQHAYYKAYVFVRPEALKLGWDRDRIMATIVERGVPCFSGSCSEVYLEKAFDNTPFRPAQPLVNARTLGDTSLMFLVHPTLTEKEIEQSCQVLMAVMQEASL